MRLRRNYMESALDRRQNLFLWNSTGQSQFTPLMLFTDTTPGGARPAGLWYSPNAFTDAMAIYGATHTAAEFLAQYPNTNLYQDSAGTTPVTAFEQPVGLVLDTSRGPTTPAGAGNHAIQPTAGKQSVLTARKNQLVATATLSTQSVTVVAGQHNLSFEGAGTVTLSGVGSGVLSTRAAGNVITTTAGTLTCTVAGSVTSAQLERGGTRTSYQWVINATTYDYVNQKRWLRFDGTDDYLYTAATLDLSGTDKVTVFAGFGSFASSSLLYELSANAVTTAGCIRGYIDTTGFTQVLWHGSGSYAGANGPVVALPWRQVLSAIHDLSGTTYQTETPLWHMNGVTPSITYEGATNTGSGNLANQTLYLGARAGTSLFFNGLMGEVIIRGALTADAQVAQTESYLRLLTLESPFYGYYGYPGGIGTTWAVGVSSLS